MPKTAEKGYEFDFEKLKKVRKQRGMSQSELCAACGYTQGWIGGLEIGKNKPSKAANKLLCITLGVPEDEFYIKKEPEKLENAEAAIPDKQIDRIEVQIDRLERKIDRIEMMVRSIRNELDRKI